MSQPLGQHWLKQTHYLDAIIDCANLNPGDTVLEIGPGQGDLTRRIANSCRRVVAVELDSTLVKALSKQSLPPNIELINANILDFNFNQLPPGYKVIANIPYYITGEIIKRLVEADNTPQLAVLLVQKEVAQRLAAGAGQLSVLAITTQLLADVRLGPLVPAEAFSPPPKVDSQVVILQPLGHLRIEVELDKFISLIKLAFTQKRKKLINSLGSVDGAKIALSELGMADARPQELNFDQWQRLYRRLYVDE